MRLRLSNLRLRPAFTAIRLKPSLRLMAARSLSAAAPGDAPSAEEQKRRIEAFPYAWPWGQTIDVKTPRFDLKIKIPQDFPGAKQHKLAYKIDAAPPEVPPAAAFFVGPVGKATHALFNASVAAGSIDTTKQALDAFLAQYDGPTPVRANLLNPRTALEDKLTYVREVAVAAGADNLVADAIVALFKDKRLHKLAELRKNFAVLVSEHRKERHGTIISAEPLTEKQYDAISAKMAALVKSDEKLIISREIEPAIVGGFIIRVGNRAQDLSVATQISRMEKHLKSFFATNPAAADKVIAA